MDHNSPPGYGYQHPNQQGWESNHGQPQAQRQPQLPSQGQIQPQYQQIVQYQQQQQQQQTQAYQPPSASNLSSMNPSPSPQHTDFSQQYQYQNMQSPNVEYSPRLAQYDGISSPYVQGGRSYPSPHQQYSSFTTPQQNNQFVRAQNQQIPLVPRRQLSYSSPQQYHMPSPQILRDPSPPTTHLPAQNYQSSRQPTPDNRPSPMSDSNHSLITHSRSRSPAIQGQRKHFLASAAYAQHPASGRIQSQSPIIQPRSLELNPPKPMQQTFAMMVQSQPSVTDRYSAKVQLQAVHRERHETVQPASVLPQTSLINHKTSQLLDGKPFTNDTPYQAHSISHSQADPLQHKTSNPSPASPIQIKWLPVMSDRSPRMKLATVAVTHQSSQPSQTPPISQTFQQRSRSISKPITEQEIESVVKAEVKTKMNAKPAEEPSSPVSEIDYALLLIDLAEEFFDAAYGRSSEGRPGRREKDLNCFYKLIATGLGCLEVVLKQWRSALQPAVEAAVRLRYASVLFAETTNSIEAEEVLSKGISQCDKLRLMDLKYNMQHLLARVTFATNPKAAIKYVGAAIKDAEIQNHVPWIYAFRFLSASLSLETQQSQEILQAFGQLKIILNTAKFRGDIAVAATASAIEAMAHIKRANTTEAIELAQTALATVRSAENNPNVSKIPQLIVMAYFVDLMCSLFKADADSAYKKIKAMHTSMDDLATHIDWTTDDTFFIPIGQQSAKTIPGSSAHGIIASQQAERSFLRMTWMPKDELYALGNMLGAATVMNKTSSDKKCEELLDNADAFLKVAISKNPNSARSKLHEDLACHLQVLRVFSSCSRNTWVAAKKELNSLKVKMAGMGNAAETALPVFIIYLEAMIAQGTGDTATALILYSNPMLSLSSENNPRTQKSPIITDLSILATLNTILIIHRPSHPQHARLDYLLTSLDGLDTSSPSGNMRGAYFLILALHSDASKDPFTNPILNTKTNLREVLQIARQTGNSQFSCVSLTFMTERFFNGQFGEQAHKSASTALNLARRGKNDLWTSVAEGLMAACLETRGNTAEAEMRWKEALRLAGELPVSMQIADGDDDVDGGEQRDGTDTGR